MGLGHSELAQLIRTMISESLKEREEESANEHDDEATCGERVVDLQTAEPHLPIALVTRLVERAFATNLIHSILAPNTSPSRRHVKRTLAHVAFFQNQFMTCNPLATLSVDECHQLLASAIEATIQSPTSISPAPAILSDSTSHSPDSSHHSAALPSSRIPRPVSSNLTGAQPAHNSRSSSPPLKNLISSPSKTADTLWNSSPPRSFFRPEVASDADDLHQHTPFGGLVGYHTGGSKTNPFSGDRSISEPIPPHFQQPSARSVSVPETPYFQMNDQHQHPSDTWYTPPGRTQLFFESQSVHKHLKYPGNNNQLSEGDHASPALFDKHNLHAPSDLGGEQSRQQPDVFYTPVGTPSTAVAGTPAGGTTNAYPLFASGGVPRGMAAASPALKLKMSAAAQRMAGVSGPSMKSPSSRGPKMRQQQQHAATRSSQLFHSLLNETAPPSMLLEDDDDDAAGESASRSPLAGMGSKNPFQQRQDSIQQDCEEYEEDTEDSRLLCAEDMPLYLEQLSSPITGAQSLHGDEDADEVREAEGTENGINGSVDCTGFVLLEESKGRQNSGSLGLRSSTGFFQQRASSAACSVDDKSQFDGELLVARRSQSSQNNGSVMKHMTLAQEMEHQTRNAEAWEGNGVGLGGVFGANEVMTKEEFDLNTVITNLRRQLHTMGKKYETLKQENESRIEQLTGDVKSLRNAKRNMSHRQGSLESGMSMSESENGGCGSLKLGGSTSSTSGTSLGVALRKPHAEDLDYLESEVHRLNKELASSRQLNKKVRSQLDNRNDELRKQSDELDEKDTFIRNLEFRLEVFDKEVKKKTDESSSLVQLVHQLQNDLVLSATAVANLTDENKRLSGENLSLKKNMKEIMTSLNVEEDEDSPVLNAIARYPGDSLLHELENSGHPNTSLLDSSSSFLASKQGVITREEGMQTEPPKTCTMGSQHKAEEWTKSQGTQGSSAILTVDTGIQAEEKMRVAVIQTSPVDVVHVAVGGKIVETSREISVQTENLAFLEESEHLCVLDFQPVITSVCGVQTESHEAATKEVQTENARTEGSDVGTDVCDLICGDTVSVQTEMFETVDLGSQTVWEYESCGVQVGVESVSCEVQTIVNEMTSSVSQTEVCSFKSICAQTDGTEITSTEVQTEAGPPAAVSVQTETVEVIQMECQTDARIEISSFAQTDEPNRNSQLLQTDAPWLIETPVQTDGAPPVAVASMQTDSGHAAISCGVQVGSVVEVEQEGRGVQTESVACVTKAFGILTRGWGVQTKLRFEDLDLLESDVDRFEARCLELEEQLKALDGEGEQITHLKEELVALEGTCFELRAQLASAEESVSDVKRQFKLRKHFDSERDRWIQKLKTQVQDYETVLGDARKVVEDRMAVESTLLTRLQKLESMWKEACEQLKHSEQARHAAEEKLAMQNMLDVSLATLNSQVINDIPGGIEDWTDDEFSMQLVPDSKSVRKCVSYSRSVLAYAVPAYAVVALLAIALWSQHSFKTLPCTDSVILSDRRDVGLIERILDPVVQLEVFLRSPNLDGRDVMPQ
ncbi:hypothetical protein HDU78_001395 [Chytriomyces hyalinus]|nr:hypothetical protein HDU78_001395 [Chytriomyces hyalinus]